MFRLVLMLILALFSTFGLLIGQGIDRESPNEIKDSDEILFTDTRTFNSQKYYHEHVITTGSGHAFGTTIEVNPKERRIERKVKEQLSKLKIEPVEINIVFHFLNAKDLRTSQQLVRSQIEALNRDFNLKNIPREHPNDPTGEYAKRAANPRITFTAISDKEITAENIGIATIKDSEIEWQSFESMKSKESRGVEAVKPQKILNVWVAKLSPKLGSYATSPFDHSEHPGIVIDEKYFGQLEKADHDYRQGKTLTHLIGNYLGLKDLWSEYSRCEDDGVSDTPVHNYANFSCPPPNHLSFCDDNPREMTMNFMDSSGDECQYMFTKGQVERMHAFLQVVHTGLITK